MACARVVREVKQPPLRQRHTPAIWHHAIAEFPLTEDVIRSGDGGEGGEEQQGRMRMVGDQTRIPPFWHPKKCETRVHVP